MALVQKVLRRGKHWIIRFDWAALDPRNNPPEDAPHFRVPKEIALWLDTADSLWFYRERIEERIKPGSYYFPFEYDTLYYCDIYVNSKEIATAFRLVWADLVCNS